MSGFRLRGLGRTYGLNNSHVHALENVDADIEHGSFVTVVGRSGCGKTTLLNVLSGLEAPSSGCLEVLDEAGQVATGPPPRIGVVFQESRLMPWLTVEKNMAFGLVKAMGRKKALAATRQYLDMLGLTRFRHAYPCQISGGMAQRASLGRTLCFNPDVILMDEPFGALDAFTRRKLQNELANIFTSQGKTIVFVTHDVDEAVFLGQRVLVMDQGRLIADVPVPHSYPRDPASYDLLRIRERILSVIFTENHAAPDNPDAENKLIPQKEDS